MLQSESHLPLRSFAPQAGDVVALSATYAANASAVVACALCDFLCGVQAVFSVHDRQ